MAIGSMQKYLSLAASRPGAIGSEPHNGPLSWPGTLDGFPVRGQTEYLRGQDIQDIPHVADFHSRKFELWNPDDHKEFNTVMDRIANGWYRERRRIDRWCEEFNSLVVWLEWVQIYGEIPAKQ